MSSRISPSSSTSDGPAGSTLRRDGGPRLPPVARLVHPFPSLLDGLVVAAAAVVAGSTPGPAIVAAGSMVLLQFSIGAVNDLHDAPRDAGKPGKPIASGELTALVAMAIAGLAAAVGVLLAAAVGVPVGLALIVLGIGYAYDLALKGTVLSWLPFAVGIPILPVYGWLVGGGTLPPAFVVILPVAFLAGAVLSIANADADAERDAAAGLDSLAIRLGPIVAPLVVLGGQCLVGGIAVASLLLGEGLGVGALTTPGGLFAVAGAALVPIAGAASVARGTRRVGAAARERAWRIEATGDALLAAAWLATAAGAGWFGG